MSLINFFQKLKWELLAHLNPFYYIWSTTKKQDEESFRKSGLKDVKKYILEDKCLQKMINFNEITCLEIGAGAGRLTEFLAQNFKKVFAIDISKQMIKIAKHRLSHYSNIDFYVTNGVRLPLEEESVDFVFSFIVFQHFPSKKMVVNNLKEIHRVLRNGGISKMQFRGSSLKGFLSKLKWYYGVSFEKKELTNILSEIGFKVLDFNGENTKYFWVTFQK